MTDNHSNPESTQDRASELQMFTSAPEFIPPAELTEQIFKTVHHDLNPSARNVFAKMGLLHVISGGLSLLFCPQFGLNPLKHDGLMGIFMHMGPHACMFACGAVFVGLSALFASLVLRPEEVRVIRSTKLVQVGLLSMLSIGSFICIGADVVESMGMIWALGSLVGGLATLELGWAFRVSYYRFSGVSRADGR